MPLFILIFCLVFSVVAFGAGTAHLWVQEQTLKKAVPVSAEILSVSIGTKDSSDESSTISYYPIITYQMILPRGPVVSQQVYASGDWPMFATEAEARKSAESWPVGKKVQAFVDLERPARSFLVARRSPTWWIMWIVGLVIGAAGVANYVTKGSKYNPN
jgi:hypothetical protein